MNRALKLQDYSDLTLKDFILDKRKYNLTVKTKKALYYRTFASKLSDARDSTDFWNTVGKLSPHYLKGNQIPLTTREEFYQKVFPSRLITSLTIFPSRQYFFDSPIERFEISRCIDRAKKSYSFRSLKASSSLLAILHSI